MKNEYFISDYVLLRNNQLSFNGQVIIAGTGGPADNILSHAYTALKIDYPRFFKMDNLCKTGFLAAEVLLRERNLGEQFQPGELGVVFSNANSSLDTDIRYEQSIASAPSPSLFVYTLPNILIGELCIRHRIKGESACFVFDIFDAEFQSGYVNDLLKQGRIKLCLSGWADYYNGKAEAFFYLAGQKADKNSLEHNSVNLHKIFRNHE